MNMAATQILKAALVVTWDAVILLLCAPPVNMIRMYAGGFPGPRLTIRLSHV